MIQEGESLINQTPEVVFRLEQWVPPYSVPLPLREQQDEVAARRVLADLGIDDARTEGILGWLQNLSGKNGDGQLMYGQVLFGSSDLGISAFAFSAELVYRQSNIQSSNLEDRDVAWIDESENGVHRLFETASGGIFKVERQVDLGSEVPPILYLTNRTTLPGPVEELALLCTTRTNNLTLQREFEIATDEWLRSLSWRSDVKAGD